MDWVVARRFRVGKRRKGKNERKKVGVWGEGGRGGGVGGG